ncbi:S-adenosyl-L-methionine-dependent methyltransferase [Xylaria bambusicola]|uniref:S-adenosyl-L-methionine-dependent methyltransferase n=1 Tax=Xylaria bambusicola TaxID=326684 RepID=UPI00200724AD|nr:S-adenosyl-L-methionine-dependent methyltransferase [Xylaria bambusicola]KAI0521328.1 S-adenosyl-L-methionine-dependent methyltransferase [Xylaria bambusicola]
MASEAATTPENIKERLKASYDAVASKYNEWTLPHSKKRMEYLSKALEYLNLPAEPEKNPAFLELGCGCGLPVTQKLLETHPSARVIANDLSTTQISIARENLITNPEDEVAQRLELIPGDMSALTFPNESLDLVVAFYSIIHLPRTEQTALLERITKWLKPGGYFVANFSAKESENAVREQWLDDKDWMFWSGWGQEKTLEAMKKAGFEVLVAKVETDAVDGVSFLWTVAKR